MESRSQLLIRKYGPNEEIYNGDSVEYDIDEFSKIRNGNLMKKEHRECKQDLRLKFALIHMKLSLSDGIPQNIPGFDYLFIGSAGCAYNLEGLQSHNISHVLCLSDIVKLCYPDKLVYKRVSMKDESSENLTERFHECLPFIETAKERGKIVIHCYKGQSRSAAIICAYLAYRHNLHPIESLQLIQSVRPIAQPNRHFMDSLLVMYNATHRVKS